MVVDLPTIHGHGVHQPLLGGGSLEGAAWTVHRQLQRAQHIPQYPILISLVAIDTSFTTDELIPLIRKSKDQVNNSAIDDMVNDAT